MLEYHFKSPKFLEEILLKHGFVVRYSPVKIQRVGMIFAYKLKSENISTTYNKQGFYQLKEFAKKITITKNLKDTNIPYPVMKLVDYYFWNIGLKKYEENKSKAKNTF